MTINQRDIVEVNYLFPDGQMKPHMAIVVSNNELYENEGFFYLDIIKKCSRVKEAAFLKIIEKIKKVIF